MGSESSTTLNHIQENRNYYLQGGDVYLLAGNQMFLVHRYFLERESRVFKDQIQLPSAPGGPRNGASKSAAIRLNGVAPEAFEKLLNVFYNATYSIYDWPIEDWTTVLKLAQTWGFQQVHDLAIRELDKIDMPLINRIVLYQRFKLDRKYLIPLYGKLCSRPEGLNMIESKDIGLDTAVVIFNARERLRARPSDGDVSPLPAGIEEDDIHHTIVDLLGSAIPST